MKKNRKRQQQLLDEIKELRQKNFELSALNNATGLSHDVVHLGPTRDSTSAKSDINDSAAYSVSNNPTIQDEYRNYANEIFLSNLSHNIRTAMNGILGLTDIVLNSNLESKQYQYLSYVKHSASFLLIFLNDIVDYSKLQTGSIKLNQNSFNLRELIESVTDRLTVHLNEKNMDLRLFIHKDVPEFFVGDSERLKRIFTNLLKSIINLTQKGEITFEVKKSDQNEEKTTLHFSILNSGAELSNAMFQVNFENFTKMDLSSTNDLIGIDLGLNVAGKLLDMMDAHIWRENRSEKINVFNFSISLPVQSEMEQQLRSKSGSIKGTRIAVLCDNPSEKLILQDVLNSYGGRTEVVESIDKLITVLTKRNEFQLVLADYQFFRKHPLDIVNSIREIDGYESLPLTLITGNEQIQLGGGLDELDKIEMLPRPIRQNELLQVASNAIHGTAGSDELTKLDNLRGNQKILLVEDVFVNQKVVLALLENTGLQVDVACEGEEAVDAVRQNDYALVLMDVQMPKMDGITATKIIRKSISANKLPIVAMTAHALRGDKEDCLAAGMNDYISKPIDPREFFRMLRRWLVHSK